MNQPSNTPEEHAVIVHISVSGTEYGSDQERELVLGLGRELEEAIDAAGVGEFDGNEFGGGEAVLYMYGPDRYALWAAVEPAVRAFLLRPAYALLRPGGPDSAPERVDL